jgi:glycosyltransferase involved in cell wall biosynthesis
MYGIPTHVLGKIDINHLQIFLKHRPNFKVIGSVGVLVKRKGYSQLIDLLVKSEDYVVVIIGDGPEKASLLSYAIKSGVSERFFILGFHSNSYNYMPYFDIYIVTSYSEGFSLAMADAFSVGIPVVLSYIPTHFNSIPCDVVNFYKLENIISLDDAIIDSLLRSTFFSKKSKDFYFKYLDEANVGLSYKNLYHNLLKNV